MKEIFKEAAEELGIEENLVELVIKTYINYIRHKISKVSYKNLTTFKGVKTNFLLIGFGRLVIKNKSDKRLDKWHKRI